MSGCARSIVWWRLSLAAVVAIAVAACTLRHPLALAGVISDFTWSVQACHDRHDIYASGFATAPVRNAAPGFLGAGYDLTGAGFMANNGSQAVTMISPRHFVMAAHFPPSTNTVWFVTANSQLRSYTIDSTTVLATLRFNGAAVNEESDVLVGRLTAPIPPCDGIGYFSIANDPDVDLANGPIPVTHRFRSARLLCQGFNGAYPALNGFTSPHLGSNILSQGPFLSPDGPGLATVTFAYKFDQTATGEFHSIDGDSGSPCFVPVNNRLVLIGVHYDLLGDDTSVDSFLPYYVPQLAKYTQADGFKLSLTTLPRKFVGLPDRPPPP